MSISIEKGQITDVMQSPAAPHVVIIGGGFGGLAAATALKGAPVRVTLVDRTNHHLFQPLLYQVATAALSPADIAAPIRSVLRNQRNTTVLLGDVTSVDLANRAVILAPDAEAGETASDRLMYDYLILAPGAATAYFGHDGWEQDAPGLKSLDDAIEIRRRVFLAFEAAERERDSAVRQRLLTFVVVGGGPTGVELAGALAEIAHEALDREFRTINPDDATVYLLDAGPRILITFPEDLARKAASDLTHLGVKIRTQAAVTGIARDAVHLGDAQIDAATVIWAAGVTASPLGRSLGVPLEKGGRVPVEPDLTLAGHAEVFVVGDLAALKDRHGTLLPGLAPVATQQGQAAATNILRTMRAEPRAAFRYRDRGNIATIGRNRAVAVIYGIKTNGFVAWAIWVFIHILTLIGYRNRFSVMAQWTYAYFTHRRPARLIRAEKR
ncbi:MAG: NAD(P)/FAD-dependent oxidoreductase [Thermomicrobia bacterium]|nr:NAD(P)/FAD-dependent oxidoreductase [Thermomicrobia bacterium]MCA1723942.1 NAD(P)/FAD-dependent oxidoreductase [Thermomicrobia bacterium]